MSHERKGMFLIKKKIGVITHKQEVGGREGPGAFDLFGISCRRLFTHNNVRYIELYIQNGTFKFKGQSHFSVETLTIRLSFCISESP